MHDQESRIWDKTLMDMIWSQYEDSYGCAEKVAEYMRKMTPYEVSLMNKQGIYIYLKSRKIWHEITEHKAVYNMEELSDVALPYPEADAKNLFVRDDKKRNYYLITVKGDKRVDLNEFRQKHHTRRLSFASEQDLMDLLGLIPGAVTPLGLLNDEARKVQFFLDRAFADAPGLIGVHPNDNTATVWMKTKDLLNMIEQHGNEIYIVKI